MNGPSSRRGPRAGGSLRTAKVVAGLVGDVAAGGAVELPPRDTSRAKQTPEDGSVTHHVKRLSRPINRSRTIACVAFIAVACVVSGSGW